MASNSRFTREHKQLAILIGCYVVVFFSLALRRYNVFGNDSGDFALFDNMFWWTMRGRPFHCSGYNFSNFGHHTAFLWAQLVPVYWLFPGVKTLIFMQTVFLGATAVPIYLIARKVLQDHRTALILAAAFLLFPPLVSQNVNQVEEPSFVAVYLLFAFYFFMQEKFGLFVLFASLSCLGRENVALAVAMFGVYAALLRRDKKWIITPLAGGLIFFWLALYVLMPYFRQGQQWHAMRMFSYLGDTPVSIVMNVLKNPGIVLRHILGEQNLLYMINLVQPLGWALPLLALPSLMALPDLAINVISDNSALKVIPWHYNVVTGCFLFVGAIFGLKKVVGWLRSRVGTGAFEPLLATGLLVLSIGHWYLWFHPQHYRKLPHHNSLVRAIEFVPKDKSLIVPIRLQGYIADRERYDQTNKFVQKPEYAKQFEYVILDANERQYPPIVTQEFFDAFYKNPIYRLVFAENNVFVFQRLGGESDWKVPPL